MSAFFGHPALALLARRKFRGILRKAWRRLRTFKGAALTLLGFGLFALWIGALVLPSLLGDHEPPGTAEGAPAIVAEESLFAEEDELAENARLRSLVQIFAFVLVMLNLTGAFQHRGLFLPRNEIERLFSAPVRRSDLIRYRILSTSGRSLFGALIIGAVGMRSMPIPLLAFVGIFLGVMTIPLVHQFMAIVAGGIERKLAKRVQTLARVLFFLVLALTGLLVVLLVTGKGIDDFAITRSLFGGIASGGVSEALSHPLVRTLIAPFLPWGHMIAAPSAIDFLMWLAVCAGIWICLFELTARLPVDFRELSLETAANVAARLRRFHRGGGAAAGKVSKGTVGWRIPWLFGRGPAGAVAWRKTGAMIRKAKGTLWMSVIILAFVTILSTVIDVEVGDGKEAVVVGTPILISVLGTFYLCSGLRFDFRDDLERMEVIKAWPVSPFRLFVATLLPEVFLVSVLLMGAVALRTLLPGGGFHPIILGIICLQPLLVLAWLALDNAAFLFLPVRFTPGQEGALQNAGRGMLVMLLRMVMLALVAGLGGGIAVGTFFLSKGGAEAAGTADYVVAGVALWCTVLLIDLALLWLGGRTLRAFDVARDRG